jgi:pimeloyl-ACP methyl ester carboxylesterase
VTVSALCLETELEFVDRRARSHHRKGQIWCDGIKCPTLIVAGSDDNAVPMHHAKMLHDGIAGSKLVVIESADHALLWRIPTNYSEQ